MRFNFRVKTFKFLCRSARVYEAINNAPIRIFFNLYIYIS